jgi:hypothetical protein
MSLPSLAFVPRMGVQVGLMKPQVLYLNLLPAILLSMLFNGNYISPKNIFL